MATGQAILPAVSLLSNMRGPQQPQRELLEHCKNSSGFANQHPRRAGPCEGMPQELYRKPTHDLPGHICWKQRPGCKHIIWHGH